MKLGFICLNLPGHLNPMTALARHLRDRNHDVVFLYSSGVAGLPFVSVPEKDHVDAARPEVSQMQGEDALQFSVRVVLAQTESILKSLPAIVQGNGVDALLLDTVQFYVELGAMQLGLPYIHVSNGLHFDFTGHTPLCLYDWPHQTAPQALARNRQGIAKFAKILESGNAGVRAAGSHSGNLRSTRCGGKNRRQANRRSHLARQLNRGPPLKPSGRGAKQLHLSR